MEKTYTQEEVAQILLSQSHREEFINDIIDSYNENENYNNYLNNDTSYYSDLIRPGQNVQKITREEYKLLEFCHNTNIKEFLREEFRRNPINPQDAQDSYEQSIINSYQNTKQDQWL